MSKPCPKCDLGCDDNAAFCRWCGCDLRPVDGAGGPPVGAVPPAVPCPPPPPRPGLPLLPPPDLPLPPASGNPLSPDSEFSPPPASGYPPPLAPGYPMVSDGAPGYGFGNLPPSVPTHLVWAILSTLLCCNPLGIVSIVYAAQVNTHLFRGDIPGAQRSSRLARNWAVATVAVTVVSWIMYGIAAVALGRLGALRWLHF